MRIKSHFIKNSAALNYAEAKNKDNTIKLRVVYTRHKNFTSNQLQAKTTTTLVVCLIYEKKTPATESKQNNEKKNECTQTQSGLGFQSIKAFTLFRKTFIFYLVGKCQG